MKKRKEIDPADTMFAMYIFVIFCLVIFAMIDTAEAKTVDNNLGKEVTMDEISRGELLFKEDGKYYPAPDLSRKVNMEINGLTARITVEQEFINRIDRPMEAVYVFPLSEKSAVDSLKMIIGKKVINGIIKEKEKALKIYQQAKSEGKKASLLVQKRPNMFSTSVANIGPGEKITIIISYQQVVAYKDGLFSLRFPMAITPRYSPQAIEIKETDGEVLVNDAGWGVEPTSHAELKEQISPMSMKINLQAGMKLSNLNSLYHSIKKQKISAGNYQITMSEASSSYNDFVMEWQPEKEKIINAAVFNEVKDGNNYSLIMLMPPQIPSKMKTPRQVTFIIDVSGSMSGESIRQARSGLLVALDSLAAKDSFNIISFNNTFHSLFNGPVPASAEKLAAAKEYVQTLNADGGTEMMGALQEAFSEKRYNNEQLRQIVFITDGAIDNEKQLFSLINKNVDHNRLFTVGIGAAPNAYFMNRAAEAGRGSYTYISKSSEVKEKMSSLFDKIAKPVATEIKITALENKDVEIFPNRIPDLYAGEPLLIAVRSPNKIGRLSIEGKGLNGKWNSSLTLDKAGKKNGLNGIWAREKIKSLMDSRYLGADETLVKEQITQTALKYSLVSKYTSLVAVEELPPIDKMAKLDSLEENNIPKKKLTKMAKPMLTMASPSVFGGSSQTASPAELMQFLGLLAIFLGLTLMALLRRVDR
ncbi:MAG: marine proteobacterial sortase target protein [Desulfotalea sp.]